ncbi:transposase [Streptomyces sp. NPDC005533]|uniref:transposase n=1 Tax=Streptomyces sp. NPDC005533 TaxID=3364723 RepID=UPI0036B76145
MYASGWGTARRRRGRPVTTIVQTRVVPLLRNSLRCAAASAGTRPPDSVRGLRRRRRRKHAANVWLGENAREFTPFQWSGTEIRHIVRITNAIGSMNARIRWAARAPAHFPNKSAAPKCVCMTVTSLNPTGQGQAL